MKPSMYKRAMDGQSSIARRLIECLPCETLLSLKDIMGHANSATPPIRDANIVRGCLKSLAKSGLIKDMSSTHYLRPSVEFNREENEAHIRETQKPVVQPPKPAPAVVQASNGPTIREQQLEAEIRHLKSELARSDAALVESDRRYKALQSASSAVADMLIELGNEMATLHSKANQRINSILKRIGIIDDAANDEPLPGPKSLSVPDDSRTVKLSMAGVRRSAVPEYQAWTGARARGLYEGTFEEFMMQAGYKPNPKARLMFVSKKPRWTMANKGVIVADPMPILTVAPAGWGM